MTIHQPDLDIYANRVTPPVEAGVQTRHRLRRAAGRLIGGRVGQCGRHRVSTDVVVCRHDSGGAYFQGLATCGSIWRCPVCSAKIQAQRVGELQELVTAHQKAGGHVFLLTLTVPHTDGQSLRAVLDGVTGGWQKFLAGSPWARLRDCYGIDGYVRAVEITHGRNGWHPHIHALIFTDRGFSEIETDQFRLRLFSRWRAIAERAGLGTVSFDALDLQWVDPKTEDAAAYLVKWGASAEVSASASKQGRMGNRSAWQLLADADRGDGRAAGLWKHYAEVLQGRRHLTYSRGIREQYGLRDEVPDENAAENGSETLEMDGLADGVTVGRLGLIDPDSWEMIIDRKITADCLLRIGRGDSYDDLIFWLNDRHGISVHGRGPSRWAQGLPQAAPPPTITEKQLGGLISDVRFQEFLAATPEDVAAARATLQRQSVRRVFQQMRVK